MFNRMENLNIVLKLKSGRIGVVYVKKKENNNS